MDTDAGVVDDRYALLEVIGRGGMADVYRGQDRVLGREVAVKLMRHHTDERDRQRFHDEALLLAGLSHPGLVAVLDVGTSEGRPFLVMELVEGASLADLFEQGPLDPARAAAIGAELASTLAYVHDMGVVHRDVKPSNVLIDSLGRVRLADFGIAKMMSEASGLTATGQAIGTAAYIAPEQVRADPITSASDIYSLGLVLLEAMTGERAYPGPPTEAALARLTREPVIPTALPGAWQALLRQMTVTEAPLRPTAADVAGRLAGLAAAPSTASETAVIAVQGAAENPPVTAPVLVAPLRSRRRLGRRRVLAVAAALLAVAIAGGIGWATARDGADNERGPVSDVPSDTPSRLQEPLQELHDAVEGE